MADRWSRVNKIRQSRRLTSVDFGAQVWTMKHEPSKFALSVRELRELDGLTIAQLSDRITEQGGQVRRQSIWGLEEGHTRDILLSTIESLATALCARPVMEDGQLVLRRAARARKNS
jgi:hypothetical protein